MKIGFIALGVLLAGFAVAFAMGSSEPELQLRYKITINVQTPEGIKSGSAVREFTIDKFKGFNPDKADFNSKIYGEAVVVDLGDKKLFALINPNSYMEMLYAFPVVEKTAPLSPEGIAYYKGLEIGTKTLLENKIHWPKFVTFTDMDDPKSVEIPYMLEGCNRKHPQCDGSNRGMYEKINRMDEFFGEGVKIKNIEIEITDDPAQFGKVKSCLGWLGEKKMGLDFYDAKNPGPENYLKTSDFIIGTKP